MHRHVATESIARLGALPPAPSSGNIGPDYNLPSHLELEFLVTLAVLHGTCDPLPHSHPPKTLTNSPKRKYDSTTVTRDVNC
jgi:hypothetical protein